VRRAAPWLLAFIFAAWSYLPSAGSIPGWGGDPLFVLWTFEVAWHNLGTSAGLWEAPLFGGSPVGLAFSENQLIPALLFWPIRAIAGNGAVALGAGAILMALLAVACTTGWLRALGLRRLAEWGGLLFAGCGWLQSQYAHYQNLCAFVLPLAFWAWAAYARDPRPARLGACALAFGWIAGWNLYFLIFADLCLLVLAARARRPLVLALALAVQAPFLVPYAEVAHSMGGYAALVSYGASLRSLFGSALRPRLLLPSFAVDIESAGYLGPVWLALMAASLRRPESRPWLAAAGIAFWAALGRGYGLFDALAAFPGPSALRSTGRAQILVFLFSLPAVLGWLESLPRWRAPAAISLALIDLIPASRPQRMAVDPALWGPPSELSRELSRSASPLLVVPEADPRFMLDATQSWTPYFGGLSGRGPAGEALLAALEWRERFPEALELTRPTRVLALTPAAAEKLRALPQLQPRGCFRHLDLGEPCLFDVVRMDLPGLRLDRDTRQEESRVADWPATDFLATTSGVLDVREVDRCSVRRAVRVLGMSFPSMLPLPIPDRARYVAGEQVLHIEAKQLLFRLGAFSPRFTLVCE
jgi:hypothetical protein